MGAASVGKGVGFWLIITLFLLLPGIGLVVGGLAAYHFGDTADRVNEANIGDQDGDGRVDEDSYGDADFSESNPTQVSGPEEFIEHWDDDSDGRIDEDPIGRTDVEAGSESVRDIGRTLAWLGGLPILAFVAVATLRTTRQHMLKMVAVNADRSGPASPPADGPRKPF